MTICNRNRNCPKRHHLRKGFSLIELMVALAISLFMVLGVSYLYLGNKQTYRVEENLARMQESGRLAFEYLSRDIRQAGDFGCVSLSTAYMAGGSAAACNYPPDEKVPTVICTLDGTGCADVGSTQPIYGYESGGPTGVSPLANTDTVLISRAGNPCEGNGALDSAVTIDKDPPGADAANIGVNLSGTALTNCIKQGDILIATDCKNAAIFQACDVTAGGTIVHDTGKNKGCASPAYGNTCKSWGNNYKGGSVLKMVRVAYYVKNDGNGVPTLYRRNMINGTEAALVPNVENFQVSYGEAAAIDDYPTSYKAASSVANWAMVKSVRIDLLVRSPDDNITTDRQKLYFNGASMTSTDKRLRLVMGTTVSIRNRTLLSTK